MRASISADSTTKRACPVDVTESARGMTAVRFATPDMASRAFTSRVRAEVVKKG